MIKLSTLPPFDASQRWISYWVWSDWLLSFLVRELLGCVRYVPWRTLSETGWDIEKRYPGARYLLSSFLIGLAVHIRNRTTLKSAVEWALEHPELGQELLQDAEQPQ